MTFFTIASSSIGYNLISNLLQEGLLDHRDKLRINAIKDKITAFNRKYDNDEIDTRTFDIFLNSTGLEKKIFDFIFNNVALEHMETNEFINQISMQAIEFINSSNILNGKSQFYSEEIVFNYFNELFDELYIIRNSFLSLKDRVMLSIFTDKLENTTKYNTGDIISYNDIFSLSNKKRIIDLIINNSREVYEREIENTDNVIYSSIVINDELFADIDISYIESKSYITERRLINENTSPLVKCLEIMDDSRERYLSGVSVSDNENNPKDPYIFQAEGITITAVGGMYKR